MQTLLVVGYGDIATRATTALVARYDLTALLRAPQPLVAGVRALMADLDDASSLNGRLPPCQRVLYLAPPPETGNEDPRLRRLLGALEGDIERFVYVSTSGVYGDCGGAEVDESRGRNPQTPRAQRRADAERALEAWAAARGSQITILRVPGIYAAERLPLERLRRGLPTLRAEDDVYTNHIHAEDLAQICVRALAEDAPPGIYNASDDGHMKMGEYFDLVADRQGLPRPPRVSRGEAERSLSPAMLSFMGESRRLINARLKRELGIVLRYPTVHDGVPRARG